MKQTTLDLNGPILSFTQQPGSFTICNTGTVSIIGIATATFPTQTPANPASNTGSIIYQWYAVGIGALSDGTNTTLGASLSGTTTTTLTVSNATSPTTNGKQFYVAVDYIPSAYQSSSPITAGTGRSTGNAINEVLFSNTVQLTVFPKITIITQPIGQVAEDTATASFNVVAQLSDTTQGGLSYQWSLNGIDLTNSSTVSGATTENLRIKYSVLGIHSIQVKITHPISCDSPLFSNAVEFSVIPTSANISVETITDSSVASIQTHDLLVNGELSLLAQNYNNTSTVISMYAKERDINVEMDIYGGKGSNSGSSFGGQGGYSRIRFLMRKEEEYVISGLNSTNNNPFIYRKGTLIAVVGKGGDASTQNNGGAGGGVGVAGGRGGGGSGGSGGSAITAGSLSPNGIFGSLTTLNASSPDTKASVPNGGRVLPCARGVYWRQQGLSACSDIGIEKFRLSAGTLVTNTGSITRGYKAGYDITQTAGSGISPTTGTRTIPRTCTRTVSRTCYRNVSRTCTRTIPKTCTRIVPKTCTRTVPKTCTRTVSRTCTRTASRAVTKSTSFNHVFNNDQPNPGFFTISFTSSGDSMTGSVNGEQLGQVRSYTINASGLGLNSTNYSVSVSNTNQAAAGDFSGISLNSVTKSGFSINIIFTNNTNGAITFCRDFTVTINGTENFTETYDCSYIESYDCSTTETYDCSYTESYDCSTTEDYDCSYTESYDCSYDEQYDCSYTETYTISGGANGGSGAIGGSGGGSLSGGGGGSGYTDGSVTVVSTQQGGSTGTAKVVLRVVN